MPAVESDRNIGQAGDNDRCGDRRVGLAGFEADGWSRTGEGE